MKFVTVEDRIVNLDYVAFADKAATHVSLHLNVPHSRKAGESPALAATDHVVIEIYDQVEAETIWNLLREQ